MLSQYGAALLEVIEEFHEGDASEAREARQEMPYGWRVRRPESVTGPVPFEREISRNKSVPARRKRQRSA